jgi:hypothetical protein
MLPEANCGKSLMPMLRGVGEPAHANGCVYWVMDEEDEAYLLVLDTCTKKFSSSIRLLASMRDQYHKNMRLESREERGRGAPARGHGLEVLRDPRLASR